MDTFWIVGIAVNLLALVAVFAWAVRAWRQGSAADQARAAARHVDRRAR